MSTKDVTDFVPSPTALKRQKNQESGKDLLASLQWKAALDSAQTLLPKISNAFS